MSQTSYSTYHAAAYEGTRADSSPMKARAARNNTGADLKYGRAVVFDAGAGTSELARKLPSAAGDKIMGVTLHDHAHNPTNTDGILDDDMFSEIYQGSIYVVTEQAVTPADPVFVRYAAGAGGTQLGAFRKDADTATAVALANARWTGNAAAGEVVGLELNLP